MDRWVVRNTVGTLPAARAVCSPNPLKVCLSNPAYILPEGKGEGEGEGGEGGGECYPESEKERERPVLGDQPVHPQRAAHGKAPIRPPSAGVWVSKTTHVYWLRSAFDGLMRLVNSTTETFSLFGQVGSHLVKAKNEWKTQGTGMRRTEFGVGETLMSP